ncbi:MAG: class I SAM-dependent methyltransferase [Pseudomonadota bacterium]
MKPCLICDGAFAPLRDDVVDWEYGVHWDSSLVRCQTCGLIAQNPPIKSEQITDLYPDNYLAHSPASRSKGIYGGLKETLARRTARSIAATIPEGGTLMEIGCGNGHLLRRIASERPDVRLKGVDIEEVEITGLANFEFYHGQFEDTQIPPESIDLIYCSNLIEHVPDPLRFLRKARSTLKNRGVVHGVTPDHLSVDRYIFGKFWAGYHYPRHTFIFNHRNIQMLLRKAGFSKTRVRGSYSFWYLSLANRFQELPGTKKRGVLFAAVTAMFLPLDMLINAMRCHGSMTFIAEKQNL